MTKYEFKTEPFEHQKECLVRSWNKPYYAYLCDRGTGKTKIVVDNAAILYEQGKIEGLLIISLNGVHEQWIDEQVPEHLPDRIPYISRVWTGESSKKYVEWLKELWTSPGKLKILAMNVESFQTEGRARNLAMNFIRAFPCYLAIDESTTIKNPSAQRTKFLVNKLASYAHYRRILTGNEITRTPFDVYSQYQFLSKDFWGTIPNYHYFKHKYGVYNKGQVFRKDVKVKNYKCKSCQEKPEKLNIKRLSGRAFVLCPNCDSVCNTDDKLPRSAQKLIRDGGKFEFPKLVSYKNIPELREQIQQYSYRVLKEDCFDLPDKVHTRLYCRMNDEQKRVYQELASNMETEYKGHELAVEHKMLLYMRYYQIVGGYFPESGEQIGETNPKLDLLIYDLQHIDEQDPIIIWSRFIPELRGIAKRLKKEFPDKTVASYYGEISSPDRKETLGRFKEGLVDFMVINPMVGSTGLNLQRSRLQYNYSFSAKIEDTWQAEDRTHRSGQTRKCLYKTLHIKGTVDDTVEKAQRQSQDMATYFKEGGNL